MNAHAARAKLHALASPERAQHSASYFKTGPGEYGEGDVFVGVPVPTLRKLAREFRDLPLAEIESLLHSPVHEERLLGLLVLVGRVQKADETRRAETYDFYLRNVAHVNNWDLVDTSAPAIVGDYLADKPREALSRMAKSKNLWERRIAIVATQHFIRRGEFDDTLAIAERLLGDGEDLIHKATGWMLREVGERDRRALEEFLARHAARMPRTMLRYAIEKFPPAERARWRSAT